MAILAHHNNPILWQELIHQQRNRIGWLRYGYALGLLLLILLIGLTLYTLVYGEGYVAMQFGLATVWGTQVAVGLRAVIAGVNLISRECVGQTWDALILTGISTRQILWGKFRAALRSIGPWMIFLGSIRLAMQAVFALGIVKSYAYVMCQYSAQNANYAYYAGCARDTMTWVPWAWMLAPVMCVLLTILEVSGCVAIGMAASAIMKREIPTAVLAISIRFTPVALFSGFVGHDLRSAPFWTWWGHTLFSLANSGTTSIMELGLPLCSWTYNTHIQSLDGLLLTIMMLLMFQYCGDCRGLDHYPQNGGAASQITCREQSLQISRLIVITGFEFRV